MSNRAPDLAKDLDQTRAHALHEQIDSGKQELAMNRRSVDLRKLVMLGAVALGTALPVLASAADPSVDREATVTPSRKLDPCKAATVASAGTKVLVHIAEARGEIQEKDASSARADLREAENLLNTIRAAIPTSIVKDRIWVARKHLEYEAVQQVLPDLVPIDEELVILGQFVPTGEARSRLEKARGLLENGDKQAGLDELEAVDSAVVYEEMDLPMSRTEAYVSKALSALAIGETGKADSALRAAEDSVQNIVSAATEPLAKGSSITDTRADEQTEKE